MKDLYLNNLYDYYGKLLTDKQQKYYEDYYFSDLSLAEISENYNVSRNAVFKALKEIENKLKNYESILHLYDNRVNIESIIGKNELEKLNKYI